MPDASRVEQLLFAEELVGLGKVVGRQRSMWRDRAFAALNLGWRSGVGIGWLRTPQWLTS
eukprot:350264-Chlamydomonas_euryale.AAC.7